jgi:bacterioferritin
MVITKDILVKLLNMDLELEYSAAIQYVNHASLMYHNSSSEVICREIMFDALEEMQHAIMLAEQISRLGGIPSVSVAPRYISRDSCKLLNHDINDEADSIRRYSMRIHQAEQLQEYELACSLCFILAMEQEHLLDFGCGNATQQRERTCPIVEILNDDEFSRKWAERALHVPLRLRKDPFAE